MGASRSLVKSSNLVAYGLVSAVALGACNQLFSIDEPTHADSADGVGPTTLGGASGEGGNGGSLARTETTTDNGGSGGSDPSGTPTSNVGGSEGASTSDGGTPATGGETSTDSTSSNSGESSIGGETSTGGADSTGGESSIGGETSTGGESSIGGETSTGGATSTTATSATVTSTTGTTSMGGATTDTTVTATVTTGVVDPPGPCEGEDLHGPTLIEIPAGTGIIGTGVVEDNAFPVINPEFDVFCIDETEVTVNQYQECVDAEYCEPPRDDLPGDCPEDSARPGNHPVGCIDWERAHTYCEWAGKRLPTEKEWEYAARGEAGRPYPWGDDPLAEELLNWDDVVGATTPVKAHPEGVTPEGVYDMAGNVWEWTDSTWCSDYSATPAECDSSVHVPRGGSYVSIDRFVNPAYRDGDNDADQRFGFRCAFGAGEVK